MGKVKPMPALLKRSYREGVREGMNQAFDGMILAPLLVLRDKWGFGPQRLERFVVELEKMYEAMMEGYLSVEDVARTLEEETGIVVMKRKKPLGETTGANKEQK